MTISYIYLNSTSPRRIEIMKRLMVILDEKDYIFRTNTPIFKEDLDKSKFSNSEEYVRENCALKTCRETIKKCVAEARELQNGDDNFQVVILSADTILTDKNKKKILEKPRDRKHNFIMLEEQIMEESMLCITAVNLVKYDLNEKTKELQCLGRDEYVTTTELIMDKRCMNEHFVQCYANSGEGKDAAGGFKIQENGGFMVKEIRGDYYNVVGLPFNETLNRLYSFI